MRPSISRCTTLIRLSLCVYLLLSVWQGLTPTYGLTPPPSCRLSDLQVRSFVATPASIAFGTSATLTWQVFVPQGCFSAMLDLNGQYVSPQGYRTVQPLYNTTYRLRATYTPESGGAPQVRTLASTTIAVQLPQTVTINANNLAPLLVQALNTPNTTIIVENQVELDLSAYDSIPIQGGVILLGGRDARQAGPRLYTTTRPGSLFDIQGDNVRISGVRIQGSEMSVGDGDDNVPKGITMDSHINIEIDHNEIYGWSGVGIDVKDNDGRIDYASNPPQVHIHDNFIHHNQHEGKFGYGVSIGNGAYALIERNVFDWNRHAISDDGSNDSGYKAYENLVLPHGHQDCNVGFCWYTHAFDMHGQDNCGIASIFDHSLFNCGTAGHDMDIRRNAFLYKDGPAVKLRGTPQLQPYGAFVVDNVFAHDHITDAVQQTESGLFVADNQVGVDSLSELGTCDFDGDGIDDTFLATGQTWWYSSGGQGPWVYLNTSTKRLHEVTLGYFDADHRCDVFADGFISSGGTGPWQPLLAHLPSPRSVSQGASPSR